MATKKDKEDKQHIQVFARIRPFNLKEQAHNAKPFLKIQGKEIHVPQSHGSKRYVFDKVFDMHSKQVDIYDHAISPIIHEVLKGYNCTVFAYGQTGSGKTHTMVGPDVTVEPDISLDSDVGIIPRAMADIFDNLHKQPDLDFTIQVSYLEIYNEVLNDLLSADERLLRIYEDPKNKSAVQIHGLEEVTVYNKKDVYALLKSGAEKRKMASTFMNQCSSRSHSVFTITMHMKETTPEGDQIVKTGKLNLVDLAGSENIQRSGAVDQRAREAGNINQSLLTLGRVIKALVEKLGHVPYRESKLTRILQDSLGGKTKTAIIATTSPALSNIDETISTLDYAFRARNILTKPEVNQKYCKKALLKKYLEEIDNLKKDLIATRKCEGFYMHPDNYEMLRQESTKTKEDYLRAVAECVDFQTRVAELQRQCTELEVVHIDTKQELEMSKRSLTSSKNALKKLRVDRRIRKELIDKYTDCELHHFKTSKEMTIAFDQHIREHNFLCSKMDEFYSAMQANENALDTLGNEQNRFALNMQDYYQNLTSAMTRQFEELEMNNYEFVNKYCHMLSNMENTAETMRISYTIGFKNLMEQFHTGQDNRMEQLLNSLKLSDKVIVKIKNHLQNEHNLFNVGLQHIITCSKEHSNAINAIFADLKEMVESYKQNTMIRNESVQLHLKSICLELNKSIVNLSEQLAKIKQPIEEGKVVEDNFMHYITEYVKKKQAIYQGHQTMVDTVLGECNSLKAPLISSLKAQEKELGSKLLKSLQEVDELHKGVESSINLTNKFCDAIPSKVTEIKERNLIALQHSEKMIEANKNEIYRQVKLLQGDEVKHAETIATDAQKYTKELQSLINKLTEDINESKRQVTSHSAILTDIAGNWIENVKSGILVCSNHVSEICTIAKDVINSIRKVKQTGDTPVRKDRSTYEFPRKVNAKVLQYNNDLDLSSMSVLDESLTDSNGRPSLDFFEPSDPEYQYEGEFVSMQSKQSTSSQHEQVDELAQLDT